MKALIIEVEEDELRLPVRICESYAEMARETGYTPNGIKSACYRTKQGRPTRFERIFVEEGVD